MHRNNLKTKIYSETDSFETAENDCTECVVFFLLTSQFPMDLIFVTFSICMGKMFACVMRRVNVSKEPLKLSNVHGNTDYRYCRITI